MIFNPFFKGLIVHRIHKRAVVVCCAVCCHKFDSLHGKVRVKFGNMVQKGFKIIEVGNEDKFIDGDIVKIDEYDKDHIYCRASGDGKPTVIGDTIEVNGIKYQVIH